MQRKRYVLMLEALQHYGRALKHAHDYDRLHALTRLIRGLPTCAPYDVTLYADEWVLVSRALRQQGSNPEPGSVFARWYTLYTWMRGFNQFGGLRPRSGRWQQRHGFVPPT